MHAACQMTKMKINYRKSNIIKFMYKFTRKVSVLTIFTIDFNYKLEVIKVNLFTSLANFVPCGPQLKKYLQIINGYIQTCMSMCMRCMHAHVRMHTHIIISKIKATKIENISIGQDNSVINFRRFNSLIHLGDAKTIFRCMFLRQSMIY